MRKRWGDYRRIFPDRDGVLTYDRRVFREGTFDHWMWEQEQRYLRSLLARRFAGREVNYLDFACGSGRIINFLQPMVHRATGLDVSAAAVEVAAAKVPGAEFVAGDVSEDPSILKGPYELVTAFRFFLNAQEWLRHRVLDVLHDKLSPDGLLVFNIHGNAMNAGAPAVWFRRRVLDQEVNTLSTRSVEVLLRRHAFEVVEQTGISLLPRKLWTIAPRAARNGLERLVERSPRLQRVCVNLVFVAKPVTRIAGDTSPGK